jgi:hypothetical protein
MMVANEPEMTEATAEAERRLAADPNIVAALGWFKPQRSLCSLIQRKPAMRK